MVFSNAVFLFIFLPVVIAGYYILRGKARNYWLLLVSIFFYAWNKPSFTIILLGSIVLNYFGALLVEKAGQTGKKKLWLVLTVVCNLLILFYFKYFNFTIRTLKKIFDIHTQFANVLLPIGISFFTFQGLSYVVDVYRGDVPAQKNVFKLGMYISMFPQLVAGPIVRYKDIATEIDNRKVTTEDFAYGIQRFILGLFKKIIIADNMAIIANAMFDCNPKLNSVSLAWLGIIAYSLQIFFDFAGYSDMAIGLGRMFGFHFLENFNYPYISKSITEFWRRWHISLSSWFKEYVYIPLGGNRCKIAKQIRNILVVWMLTGIWHGANWNYVLWGCYYGALLLIEKLVLKKVLNRLPGIIQRIYTMFFVVIGWIIFKCEDMAYGISYLKAMFGGFGQGLWNNETIYLLGNYAVLFVLAILGSTMLPKKAAGVVLGGRKRTWAENVIYIAFYAVIFFVSVAYLVDATYNPFLYFRF